MGTFRYDKETEKWMKKNNICPHYEDYLFVDETDNCSVTCTQCNESIIDNKGNMVFLDNLSPEQERVLQILVETGFFNIHEE